MESPSPLQDEFSFPNYHIENHARPVHSDFLIHWTGWEIDENFGTGSKEWRAEYLERLRGILEFGLWMNEPRPDDLTFIAGREFPKTPRTCFTELKLSEASGHAKRYGGLGIGFKRFYVIDRGGLPVWYYPPWSDHLLSWMNKTSPEEVWNQVGAFLKPMGRKDQKPVTYTYYDESEWRVVYSPWLNEKKFTQSPSEAEGFDQYFATLCKGTRKRPLALLKVSGPWLAMIIYPDIRVRYEAQRDGLIQRLLREAKKPGRPPREPTGCEPSAYYEWFMDPIQMELGDCRNF